MTRGLKICCAWTALIVVVLIVTLVTVYFTVLKPKEPETFPHPVTLTRVEFSVFPALKRGDVVAYAPIIGDKIPARGKLNVSSSVEIVADKLITNPYFWVDLGVGSFSFSSLTILKGKVNAFNIFKMQATAQSMCDIIVNVKAQTANSTCYSKLKM